MQLYWSLKYHHGQNGVKNSGATEIYCICIWFFGTTSLGGASFCRKICFWWFFRWGLSKKTFFIFGWFPGAGLNRSYSTCGSGSYVSRVPRNVSRWVFYRNNWSKKTNLTPGEYQIIFSPELYSLLCVVYKTLFFTGVTFCLIYYTNFHP